MTAAVSPIRQFTPIVKPIKITTATIALVTHTLNLGSLRRCGLTSDRLVSGLLFSEFASARLCRGRMGRCR